MTLGYSPACVQAPRALELTDDGIRELGRSDHLTEQAYIIAAMSRAKGDQTVAARLLGLSRFGLQKKVRRLAGEHDGANDEQRHPAA